MTAHKILVYKKKGERKKKKKRKTKRTIPKEEFPKKADCKEGVNRTKGCYRMCRLENVEGVASKFADTIHCRIVDSVESTMWTQGKVGSK